MHDPIGNIVYSMHSSDVESSMCNGKWLMKNKVLLTIDEEDIIREAQEKATALVKKQVLSYQNVFKNRKNHL
ncbi:hypothetical protein JTT00_06045 [Clostridium botulinum]|nr:hypothetical protein [Clostridium botulinum]MCS4522127.1 hypothetical protein [Clostridium botulinum]MCS4523836.1 hypothetical protein [Clostridium botulinum]MCS4525510.1 hypothetical protein [Clostridium botulinum]